MTLSLIPATSFAAPLSTPELYAWKLYYLELFQGTVSGVNTPVFELESPLNRIQALVMVIRIMGLEKEALAYDGENNFTDTPAWAWQYAAYAYKTGLTTGINPEGTLFGPDRVVTCQEFTVFLLRALGYSEADGDFEYAGALRKAVEISLYSEAELNLLSSGNYVRGKAVASMTSALMTSLKGTDTLLIYSLMEKGIVTEERADDFVEVISEVGRYEYEDE